MLLRDPVHGLVTFEGRAGLIVEALLATREVQRLRRVRQLGLASLVYPGGEHSRFAHAVGTAHVMSRLLARIRECDRELPQDARLDQEAADDALAGAMLHDLGHGPFSHLYEEVIPNARHHESITTDLIRDDATDVHRALEGLSRGMAERVATLLEGRYRLAYLSRAVSSVLDVDRMDYLLRDSHMTGVRYGLYDLDWLLRALSFAEVSGTHVLAVEGRKGLPSVEAFFIGRYSMYQQVYHHKGTRAAEVLVRALFARLVTLVKDGAVPEGVPPAVLSACRGEQASLDDYVKLDDAILLAAIDRWTTAKDARLADLAARVRERRLPKTVPLPEGKPDVWAEALARARVVAKTRAVCHESEVVLDVASDVPYAEPEGDSPDGLWVVLRHRGVRRLGDLSFLLGELRNKRLERPRLVFPPELRDDVLARIEEVIA